MKNLSVVRPEGDENLMALVKTTSDQGAFAELFDRYKTRILSFVVTLVNNRETAAELTQETFLKVFRMRATYIDHSSFKAWLFTIARNTSTDYLRKKKELLESNPDKHSYLEVADSATPETEYLTKISELQFQNCMKKLSYPQREVMGLFLHGEFSYEELTQKLELSLSAVKSLINRARLNLLACLEKSYG